MLKKNVQLNEAAEINGKALSPIVMLINDEICEEDCYTWL